MRNITIGNTKYQLEVASSEQAKRIGLSGRPGLAKNRGMLFLYDQPDYLSFWMKNSLIPLQIIFVNNCTIVDVQEMAVEPNPASPRKNYFSSQPADKAIELNSGSAPENLIGQEIKELCN